MPLPDSQTTPIIVKRPYRKNPNNPRWGQSSSFSSEEGDCSSSESDDQLVNEGQHTPESLAHLDPLITNITDTPSPSPQQVSAAPIKPKRKYTKCTHHTFPIKTRKGRVTKRPDYLRL